MTCFSFGGFQNGIARRPTNSSRILNKITGGAQKGGGTLGVLYNATNGGFLGSMIVCGRVSVPRYFSIRFMEVYGPSGVRDVCTDREANSFAGFSSLSLKGVVLNIMWKGQTKSAFPFGVDAINSPSLLIHPNGNPKGGDFLQAPYLTWEGGGASSERLVRFVMQLHECEAQRAARCWPSQKTTGARISTSALAEAVRALDNLLPSGCFAQRFWWCSGVGRLKPCA